MNVKTKWQKKHTYINLLLPLNQEQINVVLKQLFWTENVDHWEIKSSVSISLCEKDLGFHHSDVKNNKRSSEWKIKTNLKKKRKWAKSVVIVANLVLNYNISTNILLFYIITCC